MKAVAVESGGPYAVARARSTLAVYDLSLCHSSVQLRELVPPSTSVKSPDGGDVKRPKHVVLSDTIALLRLLKDKVRG